MSGSKTTATSSTEQVLHDVNEIEHLDMKNQTLKLRSDLLYDKVFDIVEDNTRSFSQTLDRMESIVKD